MIKVSSVEVEIKCFAWMPFEVWIKIAKIVKKSMNIYHGLTVPSQAQYNNIITDKIDSGYKNGPSSLRLADIKIPQTSSK